MKRIDLAILGVIVAAYLGIAALYAVKTPAWQVPDEPAHYNYIAQIVQTGAIPVLQPGDWNQPYLNALKSQNFAPSALRGQLDTIRYEDHQPPLFYLLEAPIYALSGGSLIALRLFSALIGAGVVVAAFFVVRSLFPAQAYLALATAGFVAFLPQHLAMMAGADNDSLAELVIGLTLLACVRWLVAEPKPVSTRTLLLLGFLLGLAFITKMTAYLLVGVVGVTILLRARRDRWTLAETLTHSRYVALPALIMGGVWWLHNIQVYGWPDLFGLREHDAVVVGQARTIDLIRVQGVPQTVVQAVLTTFHSFWGQFGWMAVPLPGLIYPALIAFCAFVGIGAVMALIRFRARVTIAQRDGLVLLTVTALLAVAEILFYNLSFQQFQGRYLFPGLIAIAFGFAVGLAGWLTLIPWRAARWASVAGFVLLAAFDVYALFRFIVPTLSVRS